MEKRAINIIILLSLTILILLVFHYDSQIIKYVQTIHNVQLDYLFISIAFASNVFIIFFFLTSIFLWKEHKRRWILPLWASGFLSVVVSYILKVSIKRLRPFQQESSQVFGAILYFIKDNYSTWNWSFPSFQSMFVFSALPVLNKEFPRFKYVWLIFASFVAFSRVYFGAHYLSDVLVGAILGYIIGLLMVALEERNQTSLQIMRKLNISK